MTKTKITNKTDAVITLKDGTAGILRMLVALQPDGHHTVTSELNQTYKQYWCIGHGNDQFTLSSDDLVEWKEIEIKPVDGDPTKFRWEGKQELSAHSSFWSKTFGRLFKSKASGRGTAPPTNPNTAPPTNPNTAPPTNPNTALPTNPNTAPPTNPITAPPTNPVTAPPTNPVTAPPIDLVTVPPTDLVTVPPTDLVIVPPTDPVTVPPIDLGTVPPTDPVPVPPIDPVIAPPTNPITTPPTNPITTPPTDPGIANTAHATTDLGSAIETSTPNAPPNGASPTTSISSGTVASTTTKTPTPSSCYGNGC